MTSTEQDPNHIWTLRDQIKTDAQAIDAILQLINKCEPLPDLDDPDDVQELSRLVGDICVIIGFVRESTDSYLDDDQAEGIVRRILGAPD